MERNREGFQGRFFRGVEGVLDGDLPEVFGGEDWGCACRYCQEDGIAEKQKRGEGDQTGGVWLEKDEEELQK